MHRPFFFLLLCASLAGAADLPRHTIPRAAGPIAADGRLDEAAWAFAPLVDAFLFPWWTEGEKQRTEARLLWDETHLYVAFTAFDAHVSAAHTQRDDPVSRDDCVEVFIAPDTAAVENYFNFEFNALGTILDRSPSAQRSKEWNAEGLEVAIGVQGTLNDSTDTDSLWVAEIAIPFSTFQGFVPRLPPAEGDVWRLNLYRIEDESNRQYMAWSDTQTEKPQYHVPQRFGLVRFSTAPAVGKGP